MKYYTKEQLRALKIGMWVIRIASLISLSTLLKYYHVSEILPFIGILILMNVAVGVTKAIYELNLTGDIRLDQYVKDLLNGYSKRRRKIEEIFESVEVMNGFEKVVSSISCAELKSVALEPIHLFEDDFNKKLCINYSDGIYDRTKVIELCISPDFRIEKLR